jgi:hypothetical protein
MYPQIEMNDRSLSRLVRVVFVIDEKSAKTFFDLSIDVLRLTGSYLKHEFLQLQRPRNNIVSHMHCFMWLHLLGWVDHSALILYV